MHVIHISHTLQIHVNKTQVRVSLIEGRQRRLRRILRSRPFNSLRRLKIIADCHLGVQVVSEAADPRFVTSGLHVLPFLT